MPEKTIDPLPACEPWHHCHADGGEDEGGCDGWNDGFDGADLSQSVVCCMIILEWGLNVVEEEVEGRNVADALELVQDTENRWPVQGKLLSLLDDSLTYNK